MLKFLLIYTALLIYLGTGVYTYIISNKSKPSMLFMGICMLFAYGSLVELLLLNVDEPRTYFFLVQAGEISWLNYPGLLLSIAMTIGHKEEWSNTLGKKAVIFLPGVLLSFYCIFINTFENRTTIIPEIFWWLETLYIYTFDIISLTIIWKWQQKSKNSRERKQIRILVFFGILTLFLILANDSVLNYSLLYSSYFDNLGFLILVFAVLYVNSKYKILNISSLITADDIVDKITDIAIITDPKGNILGINEKGLEILGYERNQLIGSKLEKVVQVEKDYLWQKAASERQFIIEEGVEGITRSGKRIPMNLYFSVVYDKKEEAVGSVVICQDKSLIIELKNEILERKNKERELAYISLHDPLTGVFNRNSFEQDLIKLESGHSDDYGIIICDVDGLKLVNDTLGHEVGDKILIAATQAINKSLTSSEHLFRIGGDEFAVLVYDGSEDLVKGICTRIMEITADYNKQNPQLNLNISIGWAVSSAHKKKASDLYKEADDNMYREKLNHINSVRNNTVKALMKTLEARDFITEGHADRMRNLVIGLGRYINMPENRINDLELLAQFHDLGKVGISDNILFKPAALTPEEKTEMKRHSEIGYRIAQSLPDLNNISKYILLHHERWDGKGYPLGIKGEAIPLECRILSIIDAYDAMTNDRPYRKAISPEKAIEEIIKNSGTQFDPYLVSKLLEMLRYNETKIRQHNKDIKKKYFA